MNSDSSFFENIQPNSPYNSSFTDLVPLFKNGATSDCFKVRLFSKWHFLKRPKQEFSTHPLYIAAFEKEFDLGFTLDHPNIVRYLSKGTDGEGIYILTEYVDGLTLNEFRQNNPPFFKNEENVKRVLSQLLSALAYLHNHQIVHLDLKPENILITNNGNNVKLIDLGLSYSDCYTEITGGTHRFGSPEQFTKPESISHRSDLYAFGKIVLYLFNQNTAIHSVRHLPKPYKHFVKCCLIDDINRRVITAEDCLKELNQKPNYSTSFGAGIIISLFIIGVFFVLKNKNTQDSAVSTKKSKKDLLLDTLKINHSTKSNKHFVNSKTLESDNRPNNEQKKQNQMISDRRISTKQTDPAILVKLIEEQFKAETLPVFKNSKDSFTYMMRRAIRKVISLPIAKIKVVCDNLDDQDSPSCLKISFQAWKEECMMPCKHLYSDYRNKISYNDFELLYIEELDVMIEPIKEKINSFKR